MTFWRYLHRPPLKDLLGIIAVSVGVHVAIGTLLAETTNLAWWQGYLVSAPTGIAAGLLLARLLHTRGRHP